MTEVPRDDAAISQSISDVLDICMRLTGSIELAAKGRGRIPVMEGIRQDIRALKGRLKTIDEPKVDDDART